MHTSNHNWRVKGAATLAALLAPLFPLGVLSHFTASLVQVVSNSHSIAYPETVTPEEITEKYHTSRISILLVPGHDDRSPGAVFGAVRESDINLTMARYLSERFSADEQFEVVTTRDLSTGDYRAPFVFDAEAQLRIVRWRETLKSIFSFREKQGLLTRASIVEHNNASERISTILYGINEWSNENDIDIVLHIHFNDYASRRGTRVGKYSGFALYVPDTILPNARASRALAESMYARIAERFPPSDLPKEDIGIIPDQELIAVGAHASRRKISLLVEYGYIYERQFKTEVVREAVLHELAYQTYLGVKDFFEIDTLSRGEATTFLPYRFSEPLARGMEGDLDVLSLQAALHQEGFYPPKGKTLSDCPLNGMFGACVESAVRAYQKNKKLPVVGKVGPQTLERLNQEFGK